MSDCPRHDGRICAYDRVARHCLDLDCPVHQRAAEEAWDAAIARINRTPLEEPTAEHQIVEVDMRRGEPRRRL